MRNENGLNKWLYLPVVFSSAAILVTQVNAADPAQEYQEPKQVGSANYEYVGGRTQIGGYITDDGDVSADLSHIFSETKNSSSSVGLWAGVDLDDGDGIEEGGVRVNHNWVSRDRSGKASHVNKVFAAYDRNEADHAKATVGYGQEREHLFWEGHVSKGLTGKKKTGLTHNGREVSSKAYDYGVGGSVGTFLKGANTRIRAGVNHEWGDDVAAAVGATAAEDTATNTTLSAGIEKFFFGTPHSVSLDVAASRRNGGTELDGLDNDDLTASLGYHYDFGGAAIYQADREYRRVRVEIPGVNRPPRYEKQPIHKRVATYKNVPVYGKKTVNKSYKQLVKSTMELEGQTFFKLNSARLIPSAQARLKQIANEIKSKGYRGAIRITGNTCGLGDAVYDQRLSEERAIAVRDYLLSEGFDPAHLIARGLGKSHPKFPNTPSEDFKNRRVDIEYVTESKSYKTVTRTEQQTVQTGTRRVATGFKNVPAGYKNVMIDSGAPGAPRVIWKTEAVQNSPAWIKRALHNNIKHDRNVNTYFTTAGSIIPGSAAVAVLDNSNTECNKPVTIDVLANDTGVNPQIKSVKQGQYGSTIVENGKVVYTPTAEACGKTDEFTYTIKDGQGGQSTANVTVDIAADAGNGGDSGEFPVAIKDAVSATAGVATTIDALANDTGTGLTISAVDDPRHGTISIEGNKIIYTPEAGYSGTDGFFYEITDNQGRTNSAEVTVTVTGDGGNGGDSGEFPVAIKDAVSATAGVATTIDALANDTGTGLTISAVDDPRHGTISIEGNKIIYTPEAGYSGSDSFFYEITDGQGRTNSAEVTVTVTGDNGDGGGSGEFPVGVNDIVSATAGVAKTIDVLANDTGSGLTISAVDSPSHGTTRIEGNKIIYTPQAGYSGEDKFAYEITDGEDRTNFAEVIITVTDDGSGDGGNGGGSGEFPVGVNDIVSATAGVATTIDVLANDTGSGLTISAVDSPSHGTTRIEGNKIIYTPQAGYSGEDKFAYEITDGEDRTNFAEVIITVTDDGSGDGGNGGGSGEFPVGVNDIVSATAGVATTVDVLANDTGSGLTISAVDSPSHGTTRIEGNKIIYTPEAGYSGEDKFAYEITDGEDRTNFAEVIITVTNGGRSNTSPVAANDSATTIEDQAIVIDVISNDYDDDGDLLSVASFTQGTSGRVSDEGNGSLKYTPNTDYIGNDSFEYVVSDGNGQISTATVSITVKADGSPDPISVKNDSASTTEGKGIDIDVLANDSQGLTITNVSSSSNSFVEEANGKLAYLPNDNFTGTDTFTYSVKDVHGQTAEGTVTVSVRPDSSGPNRAPKANEDAPGTSKDDAITVDVLSNDTDPDGDTLTITNVTQPQAGKAEIINNKIVYTPNGTVGSMSMTYTISDGRGLTDQTVLTISVTDPNDGNDHPPVINNETVTVKLGESILINVLANDTDQDGDTLVLDQIDSGSRGITEKLGNQIKYTPILDFPGTDTFFYGVHDGHGHNGSGQVFVTIIE